MAAARQRRTGGSSNEPGAGDACVLDLEARRIEKALAHRSRYKYVHPRVLREGTGWKIVSPNCSRNIDPDGGEIDIAWLLPHPEAGWLLHARHHAEQRWEFKRSDRSLPALLEHLCQDPDREYWR